MQNKMNIKKKMMTNPYKIPDKNKIKIRINKT